MHEGVLAMEMESHFRHPKTALELLHDESYTADDVAQLLGVGVSVIRHAAFTGELRAQVLGHHILSLRREDVVAWVVSWDGAEGGGRRTEANTFRPPLN